MAGSYIKNEDNENISYEFNDNNSNCLYYIDFDGSYTQLDDTDFGMACDSLYSVNIVRKKTIIIKDEKEENSSEINESVYSKVMSIFDDFFLSNPRCCLIFTIDNEDARQDVRKKLFDHWYDANGNKDNYLYVTYIVDIKDADNGKRIIGLIINKKETDAELLIELFQLMSISE